LGNDPCGEGYMLPEHVGLVSEWKMILEWGLEGMGVMLR